MANRANEYPDNVFCPLIDKTIDCATCIENQDCISSVLSIKSLPDIFKQKDDWKNICKHCKYYEID